MPSSITRGVDTGVVTHLERGVAHTEWVLHGLVPVRVLVFQGRVDLVEVVVVRVADECAKNPVSSALVETKLQVLGVKFQVRFCKEGMPLICMYLSFATEASFNLF